MLDRAGSASSQKSVSQIGTGNLAESGGFGVIAMVPQRIKSTIKNQSFLKCPTRPIGGERGSKLLDGPGWLSRRLNALALYNHPILRNRNHSPPQTAMISPQTNG